MCVIYCMARKQKFKTSYSERSRTGERQMFGEPSQDFRRRVQQTRADLRANNLANQMAGINLSGELARQQTIQTGTEAARAAARIGRALQESNLNNRYTIPHPTRAQMTALQERERQQQLRDSYRRRRVMTQARVREGQPNVTDRHRRVAEEASTRAINRDRRRRMGVVQSVGGGARRERIPNLRVRTGTRQVLTTMRLSPSGGYYNPGIPRPFAQ